MFAIQLDNTAQLNKMETDKESEPVVSTSALAASRTIVSLPANLSCNYTPNLNLEFHQSVLEHCRNQSSHNTKVSRINSNSSDTSQNKKHKCSFYSNTINAPLNKVVRSCKVILSGDVAVGKTSLVNRFGRTIYSSAYQTTIGVDFDLQRFNILEQPYMLQIWDTAGLERFKCITNSYYRGCQVALLVFDMSNMSTLASVLKWRDEVLLSLPKDAGECSTGNKPETVNESSLPILFLVGTKCDLTLNGASKRFIEEQANKIASILGAELWFVSAKTGENVDELFRRVAALSFERTILEEILHNKLQSSTMCSSLRDKILQQQRDLFSQSSKLVKITRKKSGDDRRSRCVNVQFVIK